MATNNNTPIVPADILDPYPERPTSLGGVRQTTDPATVHTELQHRLRSRPVPAAFTASVEPGQRPAQVSRWPVASVLLTCIGQCVLAAAMSMVAVPVGVGVSCALSFLVCGLALIAAQLIGSAGVR